MGVSKIWVKKLWARHRHSGSGAPAFRPLGRPAGGLYGRREHSVILNARQRHRRGARRLEADIERLTGMHIPQHHTQGDAGREPGPRHTPKRAGGANGSGTRVLELHVAHRFQAAVRQKMADFVHGRRIPVHNGLWRVPGCHHGERAGGAQAGHRGSRQAILDPLRPGLAVLRQRIQREETWLIQVRNGSGGHGHQADPVRGGTRRQTASSRGSTARCSGGCPPS